MTPLPVAMTRPEMSPYWARFSRAPGSSRSGTRTVPAAGTVICRLPIRATPERIEEPSLPRTPSTESVNLTSEPVVLVYGTSTLVRSEASCGQLKLPPCTAGGPSTFCR